MRKNTEMFAANLLLRVCLPRVREEGLEPSRPQWTQEPESCASAYSATRARLPRVVSSRSDERRPRRSKLRPTVSP